MGVCLIQSDIRIHHNLLQYRRLRLWDRPVLVSMGSATTQSEFLGEIDERVVAVPIVLYLKSQFLDMIFYMRVDHTY